jgi:ADP-ribose pyrophosphatase
MLEKTLSVRTAFSGKLLKLDVLDVELANGQRAIREIVRHPGGVTILPQLPDSRFVFVRQFRKAVETSLIEAVAGTLHPGEDPAQCALRELREETGYEAERLDRLGVIAPAPGYTEERLHLYYASLRPDGGALSPDEDEKIEVVFLEPRQVDAMLLSGEIWDAKTLAAWHLWNARAREAADHARGTGAKSPRQGE